MYVYMFVLLLSAYMVLIIPVYVLFDPYITNILFYVKKGI